MKCNQCPVACGADREKSVGFCGVSGLKIAKYCLYNFEEPPISHKKGSGNIFFSGCSVKCRFCQNFEISQCGGGREITAAHLAEIFRELEAKGAENINLVNPTHYLGDIVKALEIYRPNLPIVYNTHGYERLDSLKIASEFVDIWLPDLKFIDGFLAKRYTTREDYATFALPAIEFMSNQPLRLAEDGKMLSGCIVRHLVLPMASYDSRKVVEFVKGLSSDVYLSLMSQYTPFGNLHGVKELERRITKREYNLVLDKVKELGLKNVFLQEYSSAEETYIPKWDF